MSMEKTRAASKASDEKLRAALTAGDTASVQLDRRINKQRNQVLRGACGKGGSGQD